MRLFADHVPHDRNVETDSDTGGVAVEVVVGFCSSHLVTDCLPGSCSDDKAGCFDCILVSSAKIAFRARYSLLLILLLWTIPTSSTTVI